jgi:hypothetical protein
MSSVLPDRDVALWQDSQETEHVVSANYTLTDRDTIVIVAASASGTIVITLPEPRNGRKLQIVNLSSATVSIYGKLFSLTNVSVSLSENTYTLLKSIDSTGSKDFMFTYTSFGTGGGCSGGCGGGCGADDCILVEGTSCACIQIEGDDCENCLKIE